MTDASISEMTFTMLSLLFLLLGVVLIVTIVMSTINPYEQITFANVEKMRAAMDQACSGRSVTIKFDTPQNTPAGSGLFTVMPIWIMTTNGDPNYVLYYESFPAGDAAGWEVYQTMQNRLVTYLPDGFEGKNYEDVQNYVEEVSQKAKDKNVGLVEGVMINNIILNDKHRSDFYLGEKQDIVNPSGSGVGSQQAEKIENFGEWKPNDNFFKFNNYAGLTTFEKSTIKYAPCGENSLCLKTRDGVYKFPLTQCSGIKNVQMVYDESAGGSDELWKKLGYSDVAIGGAGWVAIVAGWQFTGYFAKRALGLGIITVLYEAYNIIKNGLAYVLSVKIGELAIVSPCSTNEMFIEKTTCDTYGYPDSSYAKNSNPCTDIITYPLYDYGEDGKLVKKGERTTCVEKLGISIDNVEYPSYGVEDQCLRVFIKHKDNFCFTLDPYKKDIGGFGGTVDPENGGIFDDFTLKPIHESTGIITEGQDTGSIFVLFPTDIALKRGQELYTALDRKWWWGWP